MDKRIGFVGLGIMGKPMSRNLLKAGFEVVVYNRTASKADQLVAEGAIKAQSIADLACSCNTIVTMVTDTPDVESVVLGESGVINYLKKGSVVIDMSTISPEATRKMAKHLKEKGINMLDAPVSGGETGAIAGTLTIMVGGDAEVFEKCRTLLAAMGKKIVHVGPTGMGQTVKLMNQILVVGTLNSVVEALLFAKSQGVNLNSAIEAVEGGAAGSWQLSNLGPKMVKRDFKPGFTIDLVQKDLKLILESAGTRKFPLPATSLIRQMFYSLQATGEGGEGTQALVKALERLSGVQIN
jgi:3-hydroxyisobutyrate dehydrogenase